MPGFVVSSVTDICRHSDEQVPVLPLHKASQITGVSIVCSTVYSGTDQRKRQSPALRAFVLCEGDPPVTNDRWIPLTKAQ